MLTCISSAHKRLVCTILLKYASLFRRQLRNPALFLLLKFSEELITFIFEKKYYFYHQSDFEVIYIKGSQKMEDGLSTEIQTSSQVRKFRSNGQRHKQTSIVQLEHNALSVVNSGCFLKIGHSSLFNCE